jgi:aspartyl-tRNA(Asn)/glutamyl-tRNA(Gln) amidotransferase subunit A
MEPRDLSVAETTAALRRRDLSAVDVMRSFLDRIDDVEQAANAFIHLRPRAELFEEARTLDGLGEEAARPLHGIPVALKANFQCAGVPTSAGSKILRDWVPAEDAVAVSRIRAAGGIVLGMANMHEFANGPTGHNPHYGTPVNPWDAARVPGGSSSGSAVALALDMCALATGTDTGGSIRVPAAFNGLVGLKPTLGLVSTQGVVPFSRTLDHVGPLARTVADAAVLLRVLAGTELLPPPPRPAGASAPLAGITVGVDHGYFTAIGERTTLERFQTAVRRLESLGAEIREVALKRVHASLEAELAILFPEAALFHARWLDECTDQYADDVRVSLLSGRRYAATEYLRARQTRAAIREELESTFELVDVLATPTTVIEAPLLDQQTFRFGDREHDALAAIVRCTAPFNLTGHPAISVPCGLGAGGTPLGLQLIGTRLSEPLLLRVAAALEADQAGRLVPPAPAGVQRRATRTSVGIPDSARPAK